MLEPILLISTTEPDEKGANEKVTMWINILLAKDFIGRDIIYNQLHEAMYEMHIACEYISIRLTTTSHARFPFEVRVPIGMEAKQKDGNIVDFLLHMVDGFIDELEIYSMDLSDINMDFSLEDISYRVQEKLRID